MKLAHRSAIAVASLAVAALLAPSAAASAPAGIWGLPTSVSVTDQDSEQPRVVIGGFMMAWRGSRGVGYLEGYAEPTHGYVHYVCPAGKKEACLTAWEDVLGAAEASECVGWGSQEEPTGTIHPLDAPLSAPDPYPLGIGVSGGFTPCDHLDEHHTGPASGSAPDPASWSPGGGGDAPDAGGAQRAEAGGDAGDAASEDAHGPAPDAGSGSGGGGGNGRSGSASPDPSEPSGPPQSAGDADGTASGGCRAGEPAGPLAAVALLALAALTARRRRTA